MRLFYKFNRFEKILLLFLVGVFLFGTFKIYSVFFDTQSFSKPSPGGIFTEGIIGKPGILNPLFSNLSSLDKDVNLFIFRGLMKYENGDIVDDIATHTLSHDKKVYTFKLKKGIKWHDGADFSVDDVLYTYNEIIKSPDFENKILQEPFKDVEISKKGNDEIVFSLKEPYKFFLTNLIIGIVPKHLLSEVPIKNLSVSDFNQEPVGIGPYKFESSVKNGDVVKISLKRFDDFYGNKPYIDVVEFNFYETKSDLIKDVSLLSSIRPTQEKMDLSNIRAYNLTLNRYVALFFNTESKILNNEKVRLGLKLGLNKDELLRSIDEKNIVNSPILELNSNTGAYEYNKIRAQGALHESGWQKPDKIIIDKTHFDSGSESYFTKPSDFAYVSFEDNILIEGRVPLGVKEVFINDYSLKKYTPGTTSFSMRASTELGNLKEGENNYILKVKYNSGDTEVLQTLKIYFEKDQNKFVERNNEIASLKKQSEDEKLKKMAEVQNKIKDLKDANFRMNSKGELLKLKLLTDGNIAKYLQIADSVKKQWKDIGIDIEIIAFTQGDLQEAIKSRNYDILLYGQDLGYNLDTYSYWHSSQVNGGLNFSNLKNSQVDVLIEKIRSSHNETNRKENLSLLVKEFEKITPSIFIYSPNYYYLVDSSIKGIGISNLPNLQDRFSGFGNWYINENRYIGNGSFVRFIKWLYNEMIK